MNTTIILLDRYREACSLPSDNQVAIKLGVTRGAISNWRQGRSHAEPESVETMAKACKLDPEEWVLRVQADREIIAARKQVWLRAAQRLAASAAVIALAFCLDVQTAKSNSHGADASSQNHEIMYIMSNWRVRLRRALSRAVRMIVGPRQGVPRDNQFVAA